MKLKIKGHYWINKFSKNELTDKDLVDIISNKYKYQTIVDINLIRDESTRPVIIDWSKPIEDIVIDVIIYLKRFEKDISYVVLQSRVFCWLLFVDVVQDINSGIYRVYVGNLFQYSIKAGNEILIGNNDTRAFTYLNPPDDLIHIGLRDYIESGKTDHTIRPDPNLPILLDSSGTNYLVSNGPKQIVHKCIDNCNGLIGYSLYVFNNRNIFEPVFPEILVPNHAYTKIIFNDYICGSRSIGFDQIKDSFRNLYTDLHTGFCKLVRSRSKRELAQWKDNNLPAYFSLIYDTKIDIIITLGVDLNEFDQLPEQIHYF